MPSTETVTGYHQQTKHQLWRYARSLGYMDWSTQPDPFRRFEGAKQFPLARPEPTSEPRYETIFRSGPPHWPPTAAPPASLDHVAISQLFFDALALSAWKQFQGSRWALRVNPSSGNLHPTEGYLVCGPIQGLASEAGVYHYMAREHALELRTRLSADDWDRLRGQLPTGAVLVGLTSIHWRESWKYGERAFRYCHHDVGHAIAALSLAAAILGWQARLLESAAGPGLAALLGVAGQAGLEAEEADCLLAIWPRGDEIADEQAFRVPPVHTQLQGTPAPLSTAHHEWPIIDEVADACRRGQPAPPELWQPLSHDNASLQIGDSPLAARKIIRHRRSAVQMDGRTGITQNAFFQILLKVTPGRGQVPFTTLPWRPRVHLVLFVHRVEGLEPGIYFLRRNDRELESLQSLLKAEFAWQKPDACPASLDLWQLQVGDARELARTLSCHQDIAADGCFAVAMLAEFLQPLEQFGSWFYTRLHWEAGLIGQVLYLEAEASGVSSTGIGCFFDDATHEALGIEGTELQDLYHFTVGGAVEDTRLTTLPAYGHLEDGS